MLLADDHGINFGDIVHVDGYGDRPFFVDNWAVKTIYTPDAEWTETWFDITCAHTGEYHMAELDEVELVCRAEQADDYLLYHARHYEPDIMVIGRELDFKAKPKIFRKPERKPTQRELSNQEAERRKQARKERKKKIDALLDEYNDYKALADEFGDEEYKARVEYIRGKLTELTEEGRR